MTSSNDLQNFIDPDEKWKHQSPADEDIEEGMSRMEDEGGGVVEQIDPAGAPILRNELVDAND